jgi:hypothetical protein
METKMNKQEKDLRKLDDEIRMITRLLKLVKENPSRLIYYDLNGLKEELERLNKIKSALTAPK